MKTSSSTDTYSPYTKNICNEYNDGTAILIKQNIKHYIIDNFLTNTKEVEVETSLKEISVATDYLLPKRPYLPYPDFHRIIYNNHPTYITGDINAKHGTLGHSSNN